MAKLTVDNQIWSQGREAGVMETNKSKITTKNRAILFEVLINKIILFEVLINKIILFEVHEKKEEFQLLKTDTFKVNSSHIKKDIEKLLLLRGTVWL